MKQNKHLPDWVWNIFDDAIDCPLISDILPNPEIDKLDYESYDCVVGQIVAEYLGWDK